MQEMEGTGGKLDREEKMMDRKKNEGRRIVRSDNS